MGGIKSVNNFFKLKTADVKPAQSKNLTTEPTKKSSASKTTLQERTGLSGDMQKFLVIRCFNNKRQLNTNNAPPETSPVYFTEPLFSEGFLEENDYFPFIGKDNTLLVKTWDGETISDGNEIHYNDVMQGLKPNCFLMASIAAVARTDPQAIRDMIQPNMDADGNVLSYTVTLYDNGNPVGVEVTPDDIIQHGARSGDNGEMWVQVIEAAYGEFVGGNTDWDNGGKAGGLASTAMEILTGQPSQKYGVSSGNYSFADLQSDFNNGEAVTLTTPSNLGTNPYWVYAGHTYVVENVYIDDNGTQMVQLYNPWGYDQPPPIPFDELDTYFSEVQVN